MNVRGGLSHPMGMAAVGLLLLNDHVLKARYPGWLTGKLSDVAWLVVAPLVLAILVRRTGVRDRTAAGLALVAAGAAFTVLQLWAAPGDLWCALFGGVHTPDPTDLLCLPALLLVPLCWRRVRTPRLGLLLVATGALVATKRDIPPPHYARVPCEDTAHWDPNRPLEVHWWSAGSPGEIPRMETDNFHDDMWIAGPEGRIEVMYVARDWTLFICPLGGLRPDTEYRWKAGPMENLHPYQLPARAPFDSGVHSFRTAATTSMPRLTPRRCRELADEGPTTPYAECRPGTTWDTADTAVGQSNTTVLLP